MSSHFDDAGPSRLSNVTEIENEIRKTPNTASTTLKPSSLRNPETSFIVQDFARPEPLCTSNELQTLPIEYQAGGTQGYYPVETGIITEPQITKEQETCFQRCSTNLATTTSKCQFATTTSNIFATADFTTKTRTIETKETIVGEEPPISMFQQTSPIEVTGKIIGGNSTASSCSSTYPVKVSEKSDDTVGLPYFHSHKETMAVPQICTKEVLVTENVGEKSTFTDNIFVIDEENEQGTLTENPEKVNVVTSYFKIPFKEVDTITDTFCVADVNI